MVERDDAIADAADQPHVVLDQEDGDAAVPDAHDVAHQLAGLGRVHAGGRLVEEQEARLGRERAGDLEPPAVGVGQRDGGLVGPRQQPLAEERQQLHRLLSHPPLLGACGGQREEDAGEPARVRQCMPTSTFSSTVIWLNRRWFWKVRASPSAVMACGGRPVSSCLPCVEADAAAGRPEEAGDDVEEGGLARAVRPDQADDLAVVIRGRSPARPAGRRTPS